MSRYSPLGKITAYKNTASGAEGNIGDVMFKLTAYSHHTIRVSATRKKTFDQISYAVIATEKDGILMHAETDKSYLLTSEALRLEINKANFELKLLNSSGEIVNTDEPGLGSGWMGDEGFVHKKLQEGERFIGLGEKTGDLDRRGTGLTNWNTDAFAYATDGDPIYASIPFYIGIHHGLCYGLFVDNSYKSHFNFGASNNRFASFATEGGDINYYLIHAGSVAEILYEYNKLTGFTPLPPIWSLGYQQCRYSYYPEAEVLRMAETFREKKIPADVLYLDIHYMQDYKVFTWNKDRFPDPQRLKAKLADLGFKLVVITDPGVKKETGYEPYDAGKTEDVFLKYPDGEDYEGEVWPGWCVFPDFTLPEARSYWSERVNNLMKEGVDGIWNDMNEIATWGQKLPDIIDFNYEGETSSSKRGRNVYGMQMARAAYEGVKSAEPDKRPFILTRAGFAGVQRYSTLWTGDNVSYADHMMVGVRLVNALGLSGVPYAGYDVGGFVGEPSPELFARWIALGAFSPFFRGHSMINSRDAEPWSFGEEVEEISRNYIGLRYRLLPYLYSVFYETSQTGLPVCRSLAIDYPHDDKIYEGTFQNQYLFGPNLLIVPVAGEQKIVKCYLPEGQWYHLHTDALFEGGQTHFLDTPLDKLPVFVKAGAFIPMQTSTQHTSDMPSSTLMLHYYVSNLSSEFKYYEDKGDGPVDDPGNCLHLDISYEANREEIIISAPKSSDGFSSKFSAVKLIIHGPATSSIRVNGKALALKSERYIMLEPISNFDPFLTAEVDEGLLVGTVEIPLNDILK